jgi:hypothetical protein
MVRQTSPAQLLWKLVELIALALSLTAIAQIFDNVVRP